MEKILVLVDRHLRFYRTQRDTKDFGYGYTTVIQSHQRTAEQNDCDEVVQTLGPTLEQLEEIDFVSRDLCVASSLPDAVVTFAGGRRVPRERERDATYPAWARQEDSGRIGLMWSGRHTANERRQLMTCNEDPMIISISNIQSLSRKDNNARGEGGGGG